MTVLCELTPHRLPSRPLCVQVRHLHRAAGIAGPCQCARWLAIGNVAAKKRFRLTDVDQLCCAAQMTTFSVHRINTQVFWRCPESRLATAVECVKAERLIAGLRCQSGSSTGHTPRASAESRHHPQHPYQASHVAKRIIMATTCVVF